jgi:hypothetical protein
MYFCVATSGALNYNGAENQNNHPTIASNSKLSDIICIRENQQTRVERIQQSITSKLFLVISPITIVSSSYFVDLRNHALINFSTPNYLLSSDLKSPPFYS